MMRRAMLIILTPFVLALTTVAPVAAAPPPSCTEGGAAYFGLQSWDACLPRGTGGRIEITNLTDVPLILIPLFNDALKIAGYVSAAMVIWGGIQYSKSQGASGKLQSARTTIRNALIGLVVSMVAVAVVVFISGRF